MITLPDDNEIQSILKKTSI